MLLDYCTPREQQNNTNKKTILGILIALLLLIPLVLVGILMSLDFNQYKPQVVEQVELLPQLPGDVRVTRLVAGRQI